MELKAQLERERALRIHFEDKVQRLESLYTVTADKLQDSLSSEQITLQYHKDEVREMIPYLMHEMRIRINVQPSQETVKIRGSE